MKSSLQNLGLTGLTSGGNVKRDAWTQQFSEIITALNSPDTPVTTTPNIVRPVQPTPSGIVLILDPNLRSVIERLLEKENGAAITPEDMERLNRIEADENGIQDLTGLEYATNLERIECEHNAISDLTPLTNLIRLNNIKLSGNQITDVAPLAKLFNVEWMGLEENQIADLSPLQNLKKLNGIGISGNPVTDVSPLAGLISLEGIAARNTRITDFSPLANLPRLQWIEFGGDPTISTLPLLTGIKTLRRLEITGTNISDISGLAELTQLTQLDLERNLISDISPLSNLKKLIELRLDSNLIADISPLSGLTNLKELSLTDNSISDFSPLESLPEIITIYAQGNLGTFIDSSGPKITRSWLWMIVSTGNIGGARAARSDVDFLARASDGEVTELKVATDGTTEGNAVGSKVWTIGELSATYHSNLEIMGRDTNLLLVDNFENHVAYGSLVLESPREQQTTMLIGSNDAVKVWLNGELVHYNFVDRASSDYQDRAPVTLKTGENILLVAVYNAGGRWSGFFGFTSDTEYTVLSPGARFSLTTDTTEFQTDTEFVIHLNAANMKDLAGWQTDILFDPAILKANSIAEGNFLKQGNVQTYFRSGTIDNTTGRITGISAARLTSGGVDGSGTLLAINFTLKKAMDTPVRLRNLKAGDSNGQSIQLTSPEFRVRLKTETATTIPAWDVNEDGKIDTIDLVLVAMALGTNFA